MFLKTTQVVAGMNDDGNLLLTVMLMTTDDGEERQVRGRHAYQQFLRDQSQPGHRRSLDTVLSSLSDKQRSSSFSDMSQGSGRPTLSRSSLPIPPRQVGGEWRPGQATSLPRPSAGMS